jgi:hypothetical protein
MGHEIVVFGNRHERFEITPLAVAFSLLSRCGIEWIDKERPGDPAREWFNTWATQLRSTTVFFDPNLDSFIVNSHDRDTLLQAIDSTLSRLKKFGTEVPVSSLAELLPGGAIFDRPYSVAILESIFHRIRVLLLSKAL